MEKKTLKQLKGSERYSIIAAVLEVMEKTQLDSLQENVELQKNDGKEGEPETWKMVFPKRRTDIEELNGIRKELGKNFFIRVKPKDRVEMMIVIEAPSEDFMALLHRKGTPTVQRSIFDTEQHSGQEQK